MTKIVYNDCFGGFSLSDKAILRYAELKNLKLYCESDHGLTNYWLDPPIENRRYFDDRDINRADPILIQVIEELGKAAEGSSAGLKFRDLPPGTRYRIDENYGRESVVTIDEYDWQTA